MTHQDWRPSREGDDCPECSGKIALFSTTDGKGNTIAHRLACDTCMWLGAPDDPQALAAALRQLALYEGRMSRDWQRVAKQAAEAIAALSEPEGPQASAPKGTRWNPHRREFECTGCFRPSRGCSSPTCPSVPAPVVTGSAETNLIDDLMQMFADPYVDKLTYRAAAEIARLEEALSLLHPAPPLGSDASQGSVGLRSEDLSPSPSLATGAATPSTGES